MNPTGPGSFSPDKSELDRLFHPEGGMKNIHSSLSKGDTVSIADTTYNDLTRYGTLILNGESIYQKGIFPNIDDYDVDVALWKTQFVFNQLEDKLDSTQLAINAANLMQQGIGGAMMETVALQKGFSYRGNDGFIESSTVINEKKMANVFESDLKNRNFTYIHESVVEAIPLVDDFPYPENSTFFKIKTVVKGTLEALQGTNSQAMSFESVYTQERATMKEAIDDSYQGNDPQSYIKV